MSWRELTDSKTGKKYYYNRETKKTQWRKPSGLVSAPSGGTYYARKDPKRGKTYYINTETRDTTWVLPEGARVVEKPKKKKKKSSPISSFRGSKTSSRSPILKEKVHISPDGTVDITEETSSGKIETVHVGRDGSVDVSEHRRSAEDILSKYRKRSSPSTRTTTTSSTSRPVSERVHIGKDGTIDIMETSKSGQTEKVHIGRRGSIDVMNKTSAGVTERVHIGKNGEVTIQENLGKLRETIRVQKDGSIDIDQRSSNDYSSSKYSSSSSSSPPPRRNIESVSTPLSGRFDMNTMASGGHASPYDSILYETRALTSESVALEQRCEDLNSQLSSFRRGVAGTLGQVKDLLADLEKIELRSSPKKEKKTSSPSYTSYRRSSPLRSSPRQSSSPKVPSPSGRSSGRHVHVSHRGSVTID
jgi:hypothetical protein